MNQNLGLSKLFDVWLPTTRSSDNARFLRSWWEVGVSRTGFAIQSRKKAQESGKKWFPYMKGGRSRRWYGNQEFVVNWFRDGSEIAVSPSFIRAKDKYFTKGVTWTEISSGRFSARLCPTGFIFDVKGSCCFPTEPELTLGLLNSAFAAYTFRLLNPTVSVQVGDVARLPIPRNKSVKVAEISAQCIELAKQESLESELTYDFIVPLRHSEARAVRRARLAALESEIDSEVSGLYALTGADLAAIERELSGPLAGESTEEEAGEDAAAEDTSVAEGDFNPTDWARSWVSYSFGTVLGRFDIGYPSGIGCGDFSPETVVAIRKLIDSDGIMASDANHPQDIVKGVLACLDLMLGRDAAHATIRAATGDNGDIEDALRDWIDRQFWKYHYPLYRKRPVYWPLQSPKKKFTVWVFQERFSKDTLFRIKDQFVQVKINWLNGRIRDLKPKTLSSDTRERRAAEKEISQLPDVVLGKVERVDVASEESISRTKSPLPPAAKLDLSPRSYEIPDGATGYGYDRVFGAFLAGAQTITVEDPYVRKRYQIDNFAHFCALAISEGGVKHIILKTGAAFGEDLDEADSRLENLKRELTKNHDVKLEWTRSEKLHDREVIFSNGWTVKVGRGLDIYYPPESWSSVGVSNYNLRKCRQTKVDILRRAT